MPSHQVLAAAVAALLLSACGGGDTAAPATASAPTRLLAQAGAAAAPVSFAGKVADYTIVRSAAGVTVTEKAGAKASVTAPPGAALLFADGSIATDPDGVAPKAYRLYQAAFDRVPDLPGLGFQIAAMEGYGMTLEQVARGFVDSPEFASRYGQLNDEQFVTQLYKNVLKRAPDAGGLKFYLDLFNAGTVTRAQVLSFFSESPENIALVAPAIANGVTYTPHVVGGAGSATSAKAAWQYDTPLGVVLRDPHGTPVPTSSLSCQAVDAAVLTVSADCRSARGLRLGEHSVQVSGGGVTASLKVKVIPQRQLIGSFAPTGASSNNASLLVTGDGHVLAWGSDSHSILGLGKGTAAESPLPVLVPGVGRTGLLGNIASVFGGEQRAMAVTEDGEVVMWGDYPDYGKVDQTVWMANVVNPTRNGKLSGIVQVAGGWTNSAALADDGRVYSWGYHHGQGDDNLKHYPNLVKDPSGNGPLTGIVAIRSGWLHTLALGANGKVYAWGRNPSGETGRGHNKDALLPAVVVTADGSELSDVVSIAAGRDFSLALRADGSVWAWGDNGFNDLGQGKAYGEYYRAVPVRNPQGTGPLTGITMISAGMNHALALQESGHVLSWGFNSDSALGTGPNGDRQNPGLPGRVVSEDALGHLSGIVAIATAREHNYAIRADGTVLVWGDGYSSGLGQGVVTNADSSFPIPVKNSAGTGALVMPLGSYHNLQQRYR